MSKRLESLAPPGQFRIARSCLFFQAGDDARDEVSGPTGLRGYGRGVRRGLVG